MENKSKELEFAKNLARKAILIANKYYKKNPTTQTKDDSSPVTVADEEINQLVIDSVRQSFPSHGVIGEEQSFGTDRPIVWVCDPIDGTIAFAMGEPTFMFSIAMVVDGDPVLAVVSDLANGRIFEALKGQGAFIDGVKMHVSTRTLAQSWLAFPAMLKWLYDDPQLYSALSDAVYQTNIIHGGVFKGMLIAEGLSDGSVWVSDVHPWDMAAVKLIVEEAGGRMTDRDGKQQSFNSELNGVVVSNGVIHEELLDLIRKTRTQA